MVTPDSALNLNAGATIHMPINSPTNIMKPYAETLVEKPGFVMGNISAGIDETQALLWAGAGATADLLGLDELSQSAYQQYQANMDEAAKMPREVESVFDVDSAGSFGTWAAESTLRALPTMAASLMGAGVAAVGARTLGTSLISSATAGAIETQTANLIAQGYVREQAKSLATKSVLGKMGATSGAIGATAAMEGGANWAQDVKEQGFAHTSPGQDILFGVVSGITETLLGAEAGIIKKFTGTPVAKDVESSFWRYITGGLKGVLGEGTQEGLQELISITNEKLNRDGLGSVDMNATDLKRIIDSAAAGAVVGGVMSPLSTSRNPSVVDPAIKQEKMAQNINDAIDNPVNADAEIKRVVEAKDPFSTVTKDEAAYLAEREKTYAEHVNTIETNYKKAADKTVKDLASIAKAMQELEHPITPKGIEMSQEDRAKERAKLEVQQAQLIASVAKQQDNKKTAVQNLGKRWETEQEKAGKRVISAQRESIINQDKARRAEFETSPFVFSQLKQVSSDAENFANRQVKILGDRVNSILRALGKYNQMLDSGELRRFENEQVYGKFMANADALRNKLRETNNQLAAIQQKAKEVIRKTADVETADLGTIQLMMNDLYSMRDLKAEGAKNQDVVAVFTDNARSVMDLSVKEQVDRANKLGYEVSEKDVEKDPRVIERRELLSNYYGKKIGREISSENEIVQQDRENEDAVRKAFSLVNAERTAAARTVERSRAAGVRGRLDQTRSLADRRRASAAAIKEQRDRAFAAEEQTYSDRRQAEMFAAQVDPYNRDAYARQLAGIEGNKPISVIDMGANPAAVTPPRMYTPHQTAESMEQMEQVNQQVLQHQLVHDAAMQEVEQLAEVAEFNKLKAGPTQGKVQVYNSIKNMLDKLPALKEVTVTCSSHTDVRVPVDLHAAIVTNIQHGMPVPKGAYYNGKVYLFVSAIDNSAQAAKTLLHEGVGHFGLRAMFSDAELGNFLRFTKESLSDTKDWNKFLDLRPYLKTEPTIIQAEEYIAWIAEQKRAGTTLAEYTLATTWNKIVRFFDEVLSKILSYASGKDPVRKLTRVDLDALIDTVMKGLTQPKLRPDNAMQSVVYTSDAANVIPVNAAQDMAFGWGFVFSNIKKAEAWYKGYNQTTSGVPGTTNVNSTPSFKNIATFTSKLSDQSDSIKEAIRKIPIKYLVKVVPNQQGINAYYAGKHLGQFKGPNFLAKVLQGDEVLNTVTFQEVYEHLAKETGDKKIASAIMFQAGVAGVRADYKGKNAYLVYNGDDLLLQTPRYLAENANTPPVSYVGENLDKIQNYNWKSMSAMRQLFSREKWVERVHNVQKKGVSVDDDNQIVKHSPWDRFVEQIADPYRRLKVVQDSIKIMYEGLNKNVINPVTNVYKQLSGLSNIIHSTQIEFANKYVTPLTDALYAMSLPTETLEQLKRVGNKLDRTGQIVDLKFAVLGDYTRAVHALERNAEIRSRIKFRKNKNRPVAPDTSDYQGGPSGMSDEAAQKVIARLENVPGIKAAAEALYEINRQQLNYVEKYKLIPKADLDKIRTTYKHYVPLRGWSEYIQEFLPDNKYRTSSGLSTGGKKVVRTAKGRASELPENPVIASITNAMNTISVGEKNLKSRNFLELVRSTPELDIWEEADKETPHYRIQSDGAGALVFRKKRDQLEGKGHSFVNVIDESGTVVRIAVKDIPLAAAMRNENMQHTHPIIDFIREWTRRLATLYTNYNPDFFLPNSIRDWESAMLNLGGVIDDNKKKGLIDKGAELRKNITKDLVTFRVPRVLWKILNGKPIVTNDEQYLADTYNDFRRLGGHTRMFSAREYQEAYSFLRSEVRKNENTFLSTGTKAFDYLDKMSDVSENSTRFSVYVNVVEEFEKATKAKAKAAGWPAAQLAEQLEFDKQRAANIALEITVNFTRKGTWSPITNALYAFSSASIGGNARILRNLFRKGATPRDRALLLSKFMGSGIVGAMALGAMNRMLMGDDDDGINKYDKISDDVKSRNLIIAAPWGDGGYIKIPIAYGYNVFWIMGNELDKLRRGKSSPAKSAVKIATSVFDNFSPIGGGEGGFPVVIPTLFRPIAELAVNKNFAGTPIYPKAMGYKGDGPDAYKYFMSNPVIYQEIAQTLNAISGGNRTRSGFFDVSPESIQHLVNSYLGGLGKVMIDTLSMPVTMYRTGGAMPVNDIPFVKKFIGGVGYQDTASEYARAANEVFIQANSVALAEKDGSISKKEKIEIARDSRMGMSLKPSLDSTNKMLADIKKREEAVLKRYPSRGKAYTEQMKLLEQSKERAMKRFLKSANGRGLDYD